MNTLSSRPAAACDLPRATGAAPTLAPTLAQTFAQTLNELANGRVAWVRSVSNPADAPESAERLEEVGFIPGERVMVMARGMPGGDPLVVRVGNSTFALRRAEAACVHIATSAA